MFLTKKVCMCGKTHTQQNTRMIGITDGIDWFRPNTSIVWFICNRCNSSRVLIMDHVENKRLLEYYHKRLVKEIK